MRIPVAAGEAVVVAAPDLHEPHAPFEQPAGRQAAEPEVVRLLLGIDLAGPARPRPVEAVELEHVLRFTGQIERLGRGQLHLRREFVALDPGLQTAVALAALQMMTVETADQVTGGGVGGAGHKRGGLVRPEVGQRLVGCGLHDRAAVLRRQEAGIPVLHAIGAVAAVVGEHDEGRQVVVHRAERVAHPAAGAGEARQHEAGRLQERGRRVHA